MNIFKNKYLKYKNKYINLKGGQLNKRDLHFYAHALLEEESSPFTGNNIHNVIEYLKKIFPNVNINEQFIDDIVLQKFNFFIFKSSNDNYYFNVKKNNTNNGIELENSLNIVEADVYIYNYEPIYINIPTTYNIDGSTAYIYINRYKMQRNEVIRIGFYYVQIIKWSVFYNSFRYW